MTTQTNSEQQLTMFKKAFQVLQQQQEEQLAVMHKMHKEQMDQFAALFNQTLNLKETPNGAEETEDPATTSSASVTARKEDVEKEAKSSVEPADVGEETTIDVELPLAALHSIAELRTETLKEQQDELQQDLSTADASTADDAPTTPQPQETAEEEDDDDADRQQEALLRELIRSPRDGQPLPRVPKALLSNEARAQFRAALTTAVKALRANGTVVKRLLGNESDDMPLHSLNDPDATVDAMLEAAVQHNDTLPTPAGSLYACDVGAVVRRWLLWTRLLPRVVPHYAVKSNPCTELLVVLAALGVSFDCASEAEIQAALSLNNVTPDNIIYANPCKPRSHVSAAAALGVHTMTFDNSDELRKMLALNPDARLVIRLLVDDSTSVMPFGTKFGASLSEACALMDECRTLGGNLVGFAFHVGSGCLSPLAYRAALLLARAAFDEAALRGFHCSLLDIGGGFPGGSASDDRLEFDAIAAVVAPTLDELFDESVRVIAEPGRFFCTAPFALSVVVNAARERYRSPAQLAVVNRISSVEQTAEDDDAEYSEGRMPDTPVERNADGELNNLPKDELVRRGLLVKETLYYISDGVYGSFNSIVFDHAKPITLLAPDVAKRTANEPLVPSCLFGPTCDSLDIVAKDVLLPRLKQGDRLFFRHMGAYTRAAASAFNGFAVPDVSFYY